jgi:hypothetical protein
MFAAGARSPVEARMQPFPRWLPPAVLSLTVVLVLVVMLAMPKPAGAQTTRVVPPLSSADVSTARSAPIAQGGKEVVTSTWGTTPAAIFAVDVTAGTNRTSPRFVQNIRITNRHASQTLCVFDLAWHASNNCTTQCAAAVRTCSGASTDGAPIAAGASYAESWTGDACLCAVGSAASTTATAERVMRYPL